MRLFPMRRLQRTLTAKAERALEQVSYLPHTFQLIWAASRYWTLAWMVLLVVQGILPAATVYLTRSVVDSLVTVLGSGTTWSNVQPLLVPVACMAGVLVLTELVQSLNEWIRTAQSELVQDHISALIHQQSVAIDYGCYESSTFNDHLSRAREGADMRSLALLEHTGSVLQNSITLFAVAAILIPYGLWLPLILFITALPAFYVALQTNLRQYQWSQRTTTDRRWLQYYDMLLTYSWTAAEVRLFNLGAYFQPIYQRLRCRLRQEQMQLIQAQSVSRLVAGFMALLIAGVTLAWMGRQVLLGLITLGDLALFYQAFNRGQGIIKSLLSSLGQIYKNSLFVRNLFEFLQLQPQIVDPPHPTAQPTLTQGIQFRQVCFRYPGSATRTLDHFNLQIPAGKIVAIVGDNGAGKSTLIKLLCRFYDPEAGGITWDGIDLREFSVAELRQCMTVLFQFPISYQLTAADNIALGNLANQASGDLGGNTLEEIMAAAQDAGIHERILRLPQGYDSLLGKWFPGGTDLSGGEWQRLALARAFLRKAQLIILDEPTSAMDPWAEFDWLERFRMMASGRTAIVITHRFTLAMRADIIHVMRAGKIVESGNHDQLLAQNGLYAESWRSQMQAISPVSSETAYELSDDYSR